MKRHMDVMAAAMDRPSNATPEGQLGNALINLASQWEEMGIDPDDFVKCGACHEYFVNEDGTDRDCKCDREKKVA